LLKFIFIFTVGLLANAAFCQEPILTKQIRINKAIALEKSINPSIKFLDKKVFLSKEYYPLVDKYPTGSPIIAERKAVSYLPLYAEYYYSPKDSIVRLISYDWEKDEYGNFFDKQKIWEEESKKFGLYNKEYERIKTFLLSDLGTPTSADTVAKKTDTDQGSYFSRETVWETNNQHADLEMIFGAMTYRIRLTIYWKQ
jgi:hypothetical protein